MPPRKRTRRTNRFYCLFENSAGASRNSFSCLPWEKDWNFYNGHFSMRFIFLLLRRRGNARFSFEFFPAFDTRCIEDIGPPLPPPLSFFFRKSSTLQPLMRGLSRFSFSNLLIFVRLFSISSFCTRMPTKTLCWIIIDVVAEFAIFSP